MILLCAKWRVIEINKCMPKRVAFIKISWRIFLSFSDPQHADTMRRVTYNITCRILGIIHIYHCKEMMRVTPPFVLSQHDEKGDWYFIYQQKYTKILLKQLQQPVFLVLIKPLHLI